MLHKSFIFRLPHPRPARTALHCALAPPSRHGVTEAKLAFSSVFLGEKSEGLTPFSHIYVCYAHVFPP